MRTPRSRRVVIVFGLLLAVAACSSSSPTQTPPPGNNNPNPVQSASVTANNNNTFTPNRVDLVAGGTVNFSNAGGLHNVATGLWSCAQGCNDQGGDGSPSTESWSFTRTFPTAGTVGFVCDEHAGVGMNGQIIVH